ncbi:MAG TPA: hypothetical protein VE779_10380 [Candidatus Angelobacter sp.]|nr:hypothetical protein [Candidatus Angelobacter sp.]
MTLFVAGTAISTALHLHVLFLNIWRTFLASIHAGFIGFNFPPGTSASCQRKDSAAHCDHALAMRHRITQPHARFFLDYFFSGHYTKKKL